MSNPKKPRNPIAMTMTEDTLSRVCSLLTVLQNHRYTDDVMGEQTSFGIYLILESAIEALEYEEAKRKAGRAS